MTAPIAPTKEPKGNPAPEEVGPPHKYSIHPAESQPNQSEQAAFVPSLLQAKGPYGDEPWRNEEFLQKVAEAGFPWNPATDSAWLVALHRFAAGGGPPVSIKSEQKHEEAPWSAAKTQRFVEEPTTPPTEPTEPRAGQTIKYEGDKPAAPADKNKKPEHTLGQASKEH
jgi:hypothetical protein